MKNKLEHGIDASRLEAKSYGEYQLKNKCDDGVYGVVLKTTIKTVEQRSRLLNSS